MSYPKENEATHDVIRRIGIKFLRVTQDNPQGLLAASVTEEAR